MDFRARSAALAAGENAEKYQGRAASTEGILERVVDHADELAGYGVNFVEFREY